METDDDRGSSLYGIDPAEASVGQGARAQVAGRDFGWIPTKLRTAKPSSAPGSRPQALGDGESTIIGTSAAARNLREAIRQYADEVEPVLITGETGAGKELIARELHRLSARRDRPFVALNAAGVPDGLAGSELFGHAKGAFTGANSDYEGAFAAADGGTLFLDEIGDMPPAVQVQLLRVLDDSVVKKLGSRTTFKVDIRLITATNIDLESQVAVGGFRKDFFNRIAALRIDAPPLRDRGDDIIELAEHFIQAHPKPAYRSARLTPNAAERLKLLPFPGNVRELRNIVSAALIRSRGGKILAEHLPAPTAAALNLASALDLTEAKELMGRLVVLKALRIANGNVTKAAEIAGRSRSTMHAMMQQIGGGDIASEYETVKARLRAFIDQ
jgi:DNA-binding NtrC family response regulator